MAIDVIIGRPQRPPTPEEMLDQYRRMSGPEMKLLVESFKKLSNGDRDELMYYGMLYIAQQYAAVLTHLERISGGPTQAAPASKPN